MNCLRIILFIAILSAPAGFLSCSLQQLAGGTDTETGGGTVAGVIETPDGYPASKTAVTLFTADYNPRAETTQIMPRSDTTDSSGGFHIAVPDSSATYSILAVHLAKGTKALITGITILGDTTRISEVRLSSVGAIQVVLPDSLDYVNGYLYIPGTDISAGLSGSQGLVTLPDVPGGAAVAIEYSATTTAAPRLLRNNVVVFSGTTTLVNNLSWKYARELRLNTTPSGADVAGTAVHFPIVVRLNGANFSFGQAQANGADIRFTKSDNTFLSYEIERWDPGAGNAEIWVKADTVYGNDSAHFITMYWGNPSAQTASSAEAVFDTSYGFQGVWHLDEATGAKAVDATINHFDGTPSDTMPTNASGVIGAAQSFNGQSNAIRMIGTESGKLNFQQNGYYSISAWVYSDSLDSTTRSIVSKGPIQYGLQQGSTQEWDAYDFLNAVGWVGSRSAALAKNWIYLTSVRSGNEQSLYVNGLFAAAITDSSASTVARDETNPVAIGNLPDGRRAFKGDIDEVRLSNVAYNADWIKLCYMNQRSDDKLVVFK